VSMKVLWKLCAACVVFALAGCASQEAVDSESGELAVAEETRAEEPVVESVEVAAAEETLLDAEGIAVFETGDGAVVAASGSVTLATGGAETGWLIPASSDSSVTLYVTRDGSIPSAANNWGGPVDPADPLMITRLLEGTGTYRIVAELDGSYSEVLTIYVTWQHEESPVLEAPTFEVAGRRVSGSVEIPVSDGSDEDLRLYVGSNYVAATLYISRDGTDPTPENFWKSQMADGTYVFSSEPTMAAYRIVAVWQDVVSPVASLDVAWVE
ncbi:MAG: hypothetical protein KAU31_08630, partial [Spirochaetaceae bacterium]|nr:hypothetical protein [Spirochaetaceae bacterium]